MLATTVPLWIWTTTTVVAGAVTLALVVVLTAHVVLEAYDRTGVASSALPDAGRAPDDETALRTRLARIAAWLLVLFLLVVLVRLGIILAERPGP
jgi:hypothetical protein